MKLSLAIECMKVCVDCPENNYQVYKYLYRLQSTPQSTQHLVSQTISNSGFSQLLASRLVAQGLTNSNKLKILCNEREREKNIPT